MKRVIQMSVATVAMLVATAGQVQAAPIFSIDGPNPFRNASWAFGELFTVGGQDISVTALGAFDAGGDGFVTPGGIPVGIFRESDGSLLVSANVTSSNPLVANFRYQSISPLTLLSGVQYRVVAVNRDDLYNIDPGFSVNPLVTYNGSRYGETTSLEKLDSFADAQRIWMANFDAIIASDTPSAIPEPSSLAIFAIGACVAAIGAVRRRREQQTASA